MLCGVNIMSKDEIIELLDRFLNEHGQFRAFKSWIEDQGYSMSDLGLDEE
jgi:hypothetical protein